MKNLNKKELVQRIIHCLWPLISSEEFPIQSSAMFFMRDGWTIYFDREGAKEFRASRDQLLNYDALTDRYSKAALLASYERFLVSLVNEHETQPTPEVVKANVDAWLSSMLAANDKEFVYFAIVENLKTDSRRRIGQVTIEPNSDETRNRIKEAVFADIDRNPHYEMDDKDNIKQKLYEHSLSKLEKDRLTSLVSVTVQVKDVDKGLDIAIQRIREVIDLLRFMGAFGSRTQLKQPITLQGESLVEEKHYFAVSENSGWKLYSNEHPIPFEFDMKNIRRFEELGLSHFSKILESNPDKRTELENRLLNTIRWISEAIQEGSDTARFLMLCISLESLLCGRDEEAFGSTIGERLAFLFENANDDHEVSNRRKFVFNKVKKIYNLRSDIAHEGKPEKEEDLLELMPYALAFSIHAIIEVQRLIKSHEWQKFDNLKRYLEDLKFA